MPYGNLHREYILVVQHNGIRKVIWNIIYLQKVNLMWTGIIKEPLSPLHRLVNRFLKQIN